MKLLMILILTSIVSGCVSLKAERRCDMDKTGAGCRNYWIGELYILDYRDIRHWNDQRNSYNNRLPL